MYSLYRILVLFSVSILLTGCVPFSSTKGVIAISACVVSVIVALVGQFYCRRADRVCRKAKRLDNAIEDHNDKYCDDDRKPEKVVELKSAVTRMSHKA